MDENDTGRRMIELGAYMAFSEYLLLTIKALPNAAPDIAFKLIEDFRGKKDQFIPFDQFGPDEASHFDAVLDDLSARHSRG